MTCLYNFLMLDVHCHPDVDLKTSLESTDLGHQLFEDLGEDASGMDEMKTGKPSYAPSMPKESICQGCFKEDATVTVVHSRTKEPENIIRNADIIIAAAGQAAMIKGSWIKPGAAVIDVGTNAVDDPSKKSGYRLVGDVDFQEACKMAGCVTPVPGGVGPMTVAMLLKNTLDGAKRAIER
ncbi:Amino acid dehydrogenase family protein [Perilla frutescens var. hirtella]|uniref:Amino acid dehydrogenase family protein n=1 Tax=Perilla frutescens var. hirtella TaxID=608512 RepID=A0AAD4NXX5_PERFH|nr:Amino acid dehydrogenase family protein [Perilla frutescens var. hirtella]